MSNDALAPGWSAPDRPTSPPATGFGAPPPPPRRVTLPPGMTPPAAPGPGPYPWPGPATARHPSGLFPAGPPRPTYREPHPARLGPAVLGAGAAALWMALFGLLARTARGYAWWTVAAGVVAWGTALALARWGLRGVAVGVAVSAGLGVAIAGLVVTVHWLGGYWLLW